jgi:TRAP-type C4-dicarboxylate transport system substrate-binding protein
VVNALQPLFEAEAHQAGFVMPATSSVGPDILFTRYPVRSLDDLRRIPLWRWSTDEVGVAAARAMGIKVAPLPLEEAAHAFDHGVVDGFVGSPAGALTFQWIAQARYVTDLRLGYTFGCVVLRESSFFRLQPEQQAVVRAALAEVRARNEEDVRRADEALMGGLFQSRGIQMVQVSRAFQDQFFAAALAARRTLAARYVSPELLNRVFDILADSRADARAARP